MASRDTRQSRLDARRQKRREKKKKQAEEKKRKQEAAASQAQLEALEPRVLMSTFTVAPDAETLDGSLRDADAGSGAIELRLDDLEATSADTATETASDDAHDEQRVELVFVDTGVDDYETLVDDLRASSSESRTLDVFLLDANRDGVEQISEILTDYQGVDAIHVVSHGTEGAVQLGDAWLSGETLGDYEHSLAGWSDALSREADLLFYGCDLAAGESGEALVGSIAKLTGADVAASEDLTGAEALGGDWELEYRAGEIETQIALSTQAREEYLAVLEAALSSDAAYLTTQLAFEQNTGQTDDQVDFMARGSGYSVFLTEGDAVITLSEGESGHAVRLNLVGGDPTTSASGAGSLTSQSNYLVGNDEEGWQTGAAHYGEVEYSQVYEGIDLRYYGNQRQLEYDFIVGPGSDPDQIRLSFDGVLTAEITESGTLRLILNEQGDEIYFKAPISYQTGEDGTRIEVESAYVIHDDGSIGFVLGDYDASRELVIDPILDYTTFLGGTGYDTVQGVDADSDGNVYITGWTGSTDFPTTLGALDESYGGGSYDIYVAKLSPDGSTLLYSTFIGGTGNDTANDIEVDSSGNVYVVGSSSSTDIATVNGYQSSLTGTSNAYLLKLNSTGDSLLYASYFGGSGSETGYDLAVDDAGRVHIAGSTSSADMPLQNAYDSTFSGTDDAFIASFDLSQSGSGSLVYSSYFGGNGSDDIRSLDVDPSGNLVVVGRTTSTDLPTPNGYQTSLGGGSDAFVSKFSNDGSTLLYSTYLGGGSTDYAEAVALDSSGHIYVGGRTDGVFTSTAGAFDTSAGGSADGFVTKIDSTKTGAASLVYSTYLGGTGFDYVIGIDVDDAGVAYLAGFTGSSAFPTTIDGNDRFMTGANDGFFAALSADGSTLEYSTFIGGSGQDRALDVVWNAATGSAYVAGQVDFQDGPTSPTPTSLGAGGGSKDGYVAKFTFNQTPTANSNSYTVTEGGTLNGNVITDNTGAGVDNDPDGDPLTASVVDGPLHGTLVLNADGSFTYTPYDTAQGTNFADSDSFTYQLSDGKGGTDTATVSISVTPDATNEAPVNSVPGAQTTGQDIPLVFSDANGNQILVRDDAGGNTVEVTLTATNGTVTLAGTTGLSITGGADGSWTMTVQGALTDINNALNGLTFSPTSSYLGAASLQIATNDLGNSGTGGALSDTDLINIDVIAINDPPVNTVPDAQTIQQDGMLLLSSATGTAITVSDFDAGTNAVEVTLTTTNGTLNLPSTNGLTFSVGDGVDDATMTFTGTITDINAALEGATFVATAGFTGSASLQITTDDQGNTGSGGALVDTDSVAINVIAPDSALWLTFENDEGPTDSSEIPSITAGDVVTFSDITQLETSNSDPLAATTAGTLTYSFNLDTVLLSDGVTLASDGNTIVNAVHYVGSDIQVGSNNIQLQAGDILLSTDADEDIDGITYNNDDVFVFRPDTPGDYSQGSFFLLIDGNAAGVAFNNVTAISLVEQTTTVGGVTLNPGEFLVAHDGSGKNILHFVPGSLGATTTGTTSLLVAGADIDIGQNIGGLHLVQADTELGGVSLTSGQLLVSLQGDDSTVGSGTTIDVLRQDVFALDVSATGVGTSVATASRLFEGLDENLDNNNESIWGIGFQNNAAPNVSADTFALDENSAGGTVVGSVSASDPEQGTLTYAITGGNTGGAFAIDASTGQITVADSALLDFETTPSFSLTVAAIDPQGAYDTATITIDLNNLDEAGVNDAPENTVPDAQTIQQDGMQVFASSTGTAISIGDFDAGSGTMQVTLDATNGTLNLSGTSGLAFSVGDGLGDGTMTFTGTLADINAALEGMTFAATPGFTGAAGVQITTDDQGNTGSGGALADSDSVAIDVIAADSALWLTFENDEAGTGNPEMPSMTGGDVVTYSDITQLETSNSDPLAFDHQRHAGLRFQPRYGAFVRRRDPGERRKYQSHRGALRRQRHPGRQQQYTAHGGRPVAVGRNGRNHRRRDLREGRRFRVPP